MSACALQTFSNINESLWPCGVKFAAEHGFAINDYSGQISESGFTVRWNYDPQSQLLQIQCVDSPFYVPCSLINGQIHHYYEQAVEQCTGAKASIDYLI
jgi:hypothetical protein